MSGWEGFQLNIKGIEEKSIKKKDKVYRKFAEPDNTETCVTQQQCGAQKLSSGHSTKAA